MKGLHVSTIGVKRLGICENALLYRTSRNGFDAMGRLCTQTNAFTMSQLQVNNPINDVFPDQNSKKLGLKLFSLLLKGVKFDVEEPSVAHRKVLFALSAISQKPSY